MTESKRQSWRSPKAWLLSGGIVAGAWTAAYQVSKDTTTATVVAVFILLLGLAGVAIT